MDVPEARRVAAPTWLNARTILGTLLFCAAVVAGQRLIQAERATELMWSAARDLPQDTVIGPGDVAATEVKLAAEVEGLYLSAAGSLDGAIVTRSILAGELIHGGWIGTEVSGGPGRTMTIPIVAEHAVGGNLRTGDRVDVYATFDSESVRARTTLVVREVEILDVVTTGVFSLDEEVVTGLTVAVSPDEAARLTFAIRTGEIDVIRISGPGTFPRVTTVRGTDFP